MPNRLLIRDFKSALQFNGTTDKITVLNTASLIPNSSSFSVSFWMKYKGISTFTGLVTKYAGSDNGWYISSESATGNIRFKYGTGVGSANTLISNTKLEIGRYYFITCVHDNTGNDTIYINGIADATATATSRNIVNTTSLLISSNQVTNYLNGLLSRVKYWVGTALTAQQVTDLYENGTYPQANLVGSWELNEGAGATAFDTSGNTNHGTITGATFTDDVRMKPRKLINGNLVNNPDFEYSPPFVNVTNVGNRWIDGNTGSLTNDLFGWALLSGTTVGSYEAKFDNSVFYKGSKSLKLSTTAISSALESATLLAINSANLNKYGILVLPNTAYTFTFYMKTNVISGSSNNGAYMNINERNATAGNSISNISTKISVTTDWTKYTIDFTTSSTTTYLVPRCVNQGNVGTGTLIMDAWFDNINLKQV